VTAHVDRARIADEPQLGRWKRVGKFGVDDDCSGPGRDRNRYGDDGAACRHIAGVRVQSAIEIVVVMNGRAVLMVAVLFVV